MLRTRVIADLPSGSDWLVQEIEFHGTEASDAS